MPALSEKDEAATLDIAAKMIRKAIDRDVTFKVTEREDYTKFIARERERIVGQRFDAFDIFEGKPADYRKEVIAACRAYGTVDEVRLLLPAEDRAAAKDEAALADK